LQLLELPFIVTDREHRVQALDGEYGEAPGSRFIKRRPVVF